MKPFNNSLPSFQSAPPEPTAMPQEKALRATLADAYAAPARAARTPPPHHRHGRAARSADGDDACGAARAP